MVVRRRITKKDRGIDRKDGRKARGSTWGTHRKVRHRSEHITARDRGIDRKDGRKARGSTWGTHKRSRTGHHLSASTRAAISRGMRRYWNKR